MKRWIDNVTQWVVSIAVLIREPQWRIVSSLTAYLGLLSAGLAIALQDVVSSFARGGGLIQVGEARGDVIAIRLFRFSLMEVGQLGRRRPEHGIRGARANSAPGSRRWPGQLRHHLRAEFRPGCKHAVMAHGVEARRRNQCGQPVDQLQRLEGRVGRAVSPAMAELVQQATIRQLAQSF